MDASESYITALRFKINYYFYFMGIEERANNLCGNVEHQTKKIKQIRLLIKERDHLMYRA